jgi:tRNA(Met) cytidine acetyltransferase
VIASARQLLAAIAATGQRRLLWLAGSAPWTLAQARALVAALSVPDVSWLGERAAAADPNRRTTGLGGECGLLVVDAWAGLDLDALGAAVGTLRGGGLLVLLTPPSADWSGRTDPAAARFASFPHNAADIRGRTIQRLCGLLAASPAVRRIEGPAAAAAAGNAVALRAESAADGDAAAARSSGGSVPRNTNPGEAATAGQATAIEAIVATATGRPRRPLVLTADRGRGKSAAMGLAAARLQRHGGRSILLTAPRRSAAAAVLRHAGEPSPRFLPPDAVLAERPRADLLLVDEAAAIPAPLLEAMLAAYPCVVFATTIQGYEGTGRGFDVRFRAVLDRLTPGWRTLRLTTPIRWAQGDPLEALIDRALLLDAEPAADTEVAAALSEPETTVDTPDRDRLAGDEPLLRQAFGLLVLGHYQTRPSDLRQLLDAPDITVHLLRAGGTVLATAVSGREGALPKTLLEPILAGRRRPQGHLLPQTLSAHGGLIEAPELRFRRILRIAVHPQAWRRGLGRRLVSAIATQAAAEGMDVIGTSFGATAALIAFWRHCGLEPVHVGSRRNAASGAHAVVMLAPLSAAGQDLFAAGRQRLLQRLIVALAGPLRSLEPAIAAALLADAPADTRPLPSWALAELRGFANANRGLDATRPALHLLLQQSLPQALAANLLDSTTRDALVACGLQYAEPGAWADAIGVSGARQVIAALRRGTAALLAAAMSGPPATH